MPPASPTLLTRIYHFIKPKPIAIMIFLVRSKFKYITPELEKII